MHRLVFVCLLIFGLLLNGCSSGNSDAPGDRNAHPDSWLVDHAKEMAGVDDFSECVGCHGPELQGSGEAVSCYLCHTFNTSPPFIIHPQDWTDVYANHRGYAALNGYAECLGCHGAGLRGSPAAPSCFSGSVDGRGCHDEGPQPVPHPLGEYLAQDGVTLVTYRFGSQHGPDAKQDLTVCQVCHGEAGGPGSNPRFNAGIDGSGCEGCHGPNLAHPSNWAGPNNTFHYSAGSIQKACTLCHGTALDGGTVMGRTSCLGCHDSVADFTLDCNYCHTYPPDGSLHNGMTKGVDHTGVPLDEHGQCTGCHGMRESAAGSSFLATQNYALFVKFTETTPDIIGDHWDGNIQMSADFQYNSSNFGCDAASCHGVPSNNAEHQMSDSGLPVILKFFFQ